MNEEDIFKLAEKLADEAYGNKGVYLYSERQDLTSRLNDILLSDFKKSYKGTVMSRIIKPLNWVDNPEKKIVDIYKVMSTADVPIPHTVGNARIEITERSTHGQSICYQATLWCFNRGTTMVGYCEAWSVNEAKEKSFKWWIDFVLGFLNCP